VTGRGRDAKAPAWWRPLAWEPWNLTLEPVERRHAARVARSITEEIAGWLQFGSAEEMRSGTPVWAWESDDLARLRQAYRYAVFRGDRFAGVVELRSDAVKGHIGYWLRRAERGKGTVTMANHALVIVAFEGLKLRAVDWTADVENVASIRVMERLGARLVARYPTPHEANRTEEVRYRLERRAYRPPAGGPVHLADLYHAPA
jgi:RimJ/RimL family protein N-acetyltransferase